MKKVLYLLLPLLLACCAAVFGIGRRQAPDFVSLEDIPPFSQEPFVVLNGNIPALDRDEGRGGSFVSFSPLDALGRCGAAYANVGPDLMPTEERGSIGNVKPSGWHLVKYDIVDGKYLYNRCHLIGYQLSGENANEENLITGTRYLNVTGMLPFENQVADYVRETGNHVLYRVTPLFRGNDLVARGVRMEALSVEDGGEGVSFNVYVYNCQPGVAIDYATGESRLAEDGTWRQPGGVPEEQDLPTEDKGNRQETPSPSQPAENPENDPGSSPDNGGAGGAGYVLNHNSMKFHLPTCSGAANIKPKNREDYTGSREDLIAQGYSPCGQCAP